VSKTQTCKHVEKKKPNQVDGKVPQWGYINCLRIGDKNEERAIDLSPNKEKTGKKETPSVTNKQT